MIHSKISQKTKPPYLVSIIEDNRHTALNLQELLSNSSDFQFLRHYPDSQKAIEDIPENIPDIVILDIGLPGKNGLECLKELKEKTPNTKYVIFTVFEDEEKIVEAIQGGVSGYLLKDTPPELFLAELKVIILGGASLTPRIADKIIREFTKKEENQNPPIQNTLGLTKRQLQILNFVALGMTVADIADELDISSHTVSRHIEKIYKKMEVHSKSEAIIRGRRMGIIRDVPGYP
ncbi:response regulator [Leptospira borgpetersenii]|uniref:Receiver component of a two-component response regulator n=1 Tax=Leptospira borgpetersenii serovar Hardjo-bovis (strain JB197) TaxID=355277 RepID=Q04UI4_LEPBJ|nr:response regulator transcription factor [Leptospira borgpetersenii]ABJ75436.1 Receiver component of a two-component response regulator [Leptospira borgpetersenii serovar Hardjo-bovis str. JB197]AMX70539.1 LuxR family transcriptional regulator [Leptospira borgpetersenii serovar Hardjo]MBE8401504.1 response regulator transcription factor [Leptospira borgpetersenii serovar Tarassovi]MBE8403490.1 response regulator transcription factor [Leptospira borgpetersenii serovar Tarassovi]MBE8407126.1 r